MKAMILAAGRGERMKPLSDKIPKPLLKVGSDSLIEKHLYALQAAGFTEVVINVSYYAEQFVALLGHGERYGVRIHYSQEKDGVLGTGGGIQQALPYMNGEPFLIISGDIWTSYDFGSLRKKPFEEAHLVMVENPNYYPLGDFGLDQEGKVTLSPAFPKLTYGNIALLHPNLFANQEKGSYPLAPLLIEAINRGTVSGEIYTGYWQNVGTPTQLEELQQQFQYISQETHTL